MASDIRRKMAEGAARLLARKGLQGTSFSDVLELTGAPRGSVYHHFPDGKDQLVGVALEVAGDRLIALLDAKAGCSAAEITESFLGIWRDILMRSNFESGCAVLAVAVATESTDLRGQTASIFRRWRERLAAMLEQAGLASADAGRFAATLVATVEGAVVLSRAEQSIAPFDAVAAHLLAQVRGMTEDA
jgi:AcrR family transcriptional regulator